MEHLKLTEDVWPCGQPTIGRWKARQGVLKCWEKSYKKGKNKWTTIEREEWEEAMGELRGLQEPAVDAEEDVFDGEAGQKLADITREAHEWEELWLRTVRFGTRAGAWYRWKMCTHCGRVQPKRVVQGAPDNRCDTKLTGCVPGYIQADLKKLCGLGGVRRAPGAESTRVVTRRWHVWKHCLAKGWGTREQKRDLQKAVRLLENAHEKVKLAFEKARVGDDNAGGNP